MRDEGFGQKLHSGGEKASKCCFYLLISAQIGEFVQGEKGKKVRKKAVSCNEKFQMELL